MDDGEVILFEMNIECVICFLWTIEYEQTSITNIFGQWLLHILTMCGHFYALLFQYGVFVENDEISLMKFICMSRWSV